MIDYHCHLLPALDDGPRTLAEALIMAQSLADFGFRVVHCTPHCIAGHYEFSPVEVRAAVDRLQSALDKAGIPVQLRPGMEYSLDDGFPRFAANLLPLGDSRLVLCEAPPQALPGGVAAMLELIVVQGFVPLLAHPERSEAVWTMLEAQRGAQDESDCGAQATARPMPARDSTANPGWFWRRWFPVKKTAGQSSLDRGNGHGRSSPSDCTLVPPELPEGTLFQANLGSFSGFYGERPQRRAYELLQNNVFDCFASDLHDAASAPAVLEPSREKLQFNPALQRLGNFIPPRGVGGSPQLAFW